MVKYEDMPEAAQKSYRITNMVRKIVLFIGWVLIIWLLVIVVHNIIMQLGATSEMTSVGIMLVFYLLIHGFIHLEFVFKSLYQKTSIGAIMLVPIILALCGMLLWVFTIIDTILFFLKKPLIYPFENKYFLR